ncbi:MAG TPA: ATP-binding protein [Candidatus Aminicenantes bacterium]|nr:ATP-binding protein [Candidatus Aminicenantes bacterium]
MFENENLLLRSEYINKLENYLDKPIIKVLTGMRRVGKSSIMKTLVDRLIGQGVPEKSIVYINKESLRFDEIRNFRDLNNYVEKRLKIVAGKKYVLIDEVQEIEDWEKTINSMLADRIADIIVSGSNARILSSELATLISGRYIEIPVHPLSFGEFLKFRRKEEESDQEEEFINFLKYGGLPGIHFLNFDDHTVFGYLNSILNTVMLKDVVSRHKIRDVSALERIVKYLMDNIGNITTAKRIADYFKSQRFSITTDTVLNYISHLEDGFLFKKAARFDLKGRKILEYYDKIFLTDIGLRNGLIGFRGSDINGILENIVYNELLYRGYRVFIGVMDGMEIDFVAEKQNERTYYQVCYSLGSPEIISREFGNLEKVKDNYRKIVISMDKVFSADRNGIEHMNLIDFLLQE